MIDLGMIFTILKIAFIFWVIFVCMQWLLGAYISLPVVSTYGFLIGGLISLLVMANYNYQVVPIFVILFFGVSCFSLGFVFHKVWVCMAAIFVASFTGLWLSTLTINQSFTGPTHITLESSFALLKELVQDSDSNEAGTPDPLRQFDFTVHTIIDSWWYWLANLPLTDLIIILSTIIFFIWLMIYLLINRFRLAHMITTTSIGTYMMLWTWDMFVDHFQLHYAQFSARSSMELIPWVFILTGIGLLLQLVLGMIFNSGKKRMRNDSLLGNHETLDNASSWLDRRKRERKQFSHSETVRS